MKAIFPAGFIIDGGTFILFGLLQWVTDTTTFLLFSYLIRFLEVPSPISYLIILTPQFVFAGSRSCRHLDLKSVHPDGQVPG